MYGQSSVLLCALSLSVDCMTKPPLRHIAFIMDGNRRWAEQHTADGLYNEQALRAIFEAISACKERGVSCVSLFAFSLENFNRRDVLLKDHVFEALIRACTEKQHLFIQHGIQATFVGARECYPAPVLCAVEALEKATNEQTAVRLQILFCYGAQQEITSAVAHIACDVANGLLAAKEITPQIFSSYLWTGDMPPPDLIIRTGKVHRLSNFLLYQAAYSELMFPDCLWPEMTRAKVNECIDRFYAIERNFGA